jgi:hypothetical protein
MERATEHSKVSAIRGLSQQLAQHIQLKRTGTVSLSPSASKDSSHSYRAKTHFLVGLRFCTERKRNGSCASPTKHRQVTLPMICHSTRDAERRTCPGVFIQTRADQSVRSEMVGRVVKAVRTLGWMEERKGVNHSAIRPLPAHPPASRLKVQSSVSRRLCRMP